LIHGIRTSGKWVVAVLCNKLIRKLVTIENGGTRRGRFQGAERGEVGEHILVKRVAKSVLVGEDSRELSGERSESVSLRCQYHVSVDGSCLSHFIHA